MRRPADLSKTEWMLMNIIWKKDKVSARDVYEETLKEKKRSYQTVYTMIDRLVDKGYLTREKFGPIWLYEPALSRANVLGREIESFVNNVLDNSFTPFLSHLAKKKRLSPEEIDTLKKIIEEHKEDE